MIILFLIKLFLLRHSKTQRAYFQSKPLSINLSDTRDWKSMYCFLEIIRYPEILDYYRKKGLGFFRYLYCRIIHLKILLIIFLKFLLIEKNNSGWEYVV